MEDESNSFSAENQNKVEGHLEAASLHHTKAANFLKEGNYEKAAENAVLAQEYLNLASELRRKKICLE
jgi:ATP/maltotriose-dependent transcriptional regulator MalT